MNTNLERIKGIFVLFLYPASFVYIVGIAKLPFYYLPIAFVLLVALTLVLYRKKVIENRSNYYFTSGDLGKARKFAVQAIKNDTRNALIYLNYAVIILAEGNAKEALTLLEKACTLKRHILTDKNIRLTLASCHWVLGDIKKAIELLEDMRVQFEYVNAQVLTTLGYLYFLEGDTEKALELTHMSLKDSPEFASSWDNLGQINYKNGDLSKAKSDFNNAILYNPNLIESHYHLGLISIDENEIEIAIQHLETALKCPVSPLNTVTKEQVQEKYNEIKK